MKKETKETQDVCEGGCDEGTGQMLDAVRLAEKIRMAI